MEDAAEISGFRLALQEIHQRLENVRRRDLVPSKWASEEDYGKLQGGVPTVYEEGSMKTVVVHQYVSGSPIVRSHKSLEDYGCVKLTFGSGIVRKTKTFATALLWSKHGGPCEIQSRKTGKGQGY